MSESEKRETHAAVIAEMRERCIDEQHSPTLWPYFDRLEAAHRRELAAVGDAAKLREAVKRIVAASVVAKNANAPEWILQRMADIFAMATTALSAPPRNCDVGTADEQQARHCAWCRKHGIDGDNTVNCLHPDLSCDLCALRWAQMPYKKGDGDGSK